MKKYRVAIVGATGAGKTTITNLLNRFYDIEDGKIKREYELWYLNSNQSRSTKFKP